MVPGLMYVKGNLACWLLWLALCSCSELEGISPKTPDEPCLDMSASVTLGVVAPTVE